MIELLPASATRGIVKIIGTLVPMLGQTLAVDAMIAAGVTGVCAKV
jgi:hypothetical protein